MANLDDWEDPEPQPNGVPYDKVAKVRNFYVELPLVVFTALPQHQDIKMVQFRQVMCLN